jgi:hypothetical protein
MRLLRPGCLEMWRRARLVLLAGLLLPGLIPSAAEGQGVPVWGRWEGVFTAEATAPEETRLIVTFTAPSGKTRTVEGFWDGGRVWKVRFQPGEVGTWRYETRSEPAIPGLDGRQGSFQAQASAAAENRFLRHGAVGVSADGRYLVHADGTPFFWLGDTAWNGALLSSAEDWEAYLADRRWKRFTVVQFVTTQWRAAYANAEGQVAYTGYRQIRINPEFFRRLDERIDAVNRAGLLAAPVLLWALGDSTQVPGKLPEDQAIRLARYIVARYQGHHVVWILAGDEDYGRNGERWRRIGRAVFDRPGHAPVTLHPQGMQWRFDDFADERWLSLLLYQSGHGDDAGTLAWLHSGPPAEKWREPPARPVINAEPPYEGHRAYQSGQPHSAYNVRRAVYWSLLVAPTAGVTYGAHGIWSWQTEPGVPLNHRGTGVARPWREALRFPGSEDMRRVAELFESLEWWRLRPAPWLVGEQPEDPARFVGAAATEAGDQAVIYLPVGGAVRVALERLRPGVEASWFNPRDGSRRLARPGRGGRFAAPGAGDWVLLFVAPEEARRERAAGAP